MPQELLFWGKGKTVRLQGVIVVASKGDVQGNRQAVEGSTPPARERATA